MTCIIGLRTNTAVWIGSDSAASDGNDLMLRTDPKIFRVKDMLIGFTTSYRMGQLLGYSLELPPHPKSLSVEKYMARDFINAVRLTLKEGGFTKVEDGVESGGDFLVAYRGRLFEIESDFQVAELSEPYAAIGCGANAALGAMYASRGMEPYDRIMLALEAAERFSTGVRGPFRINKLEN